MSQTDAFTTRRQFLHNAVALGTGVGLATAVPSVLANSTTIEAFEPKATQPPQKKGYQLTEHIAAYYKSAAC